MATDETRSQFMKRTSNSHFPGHYYWQGRLTRLYDNSRHWILASLTHISHETAHENTLSHPLKNKRFLLLQIYCALFVAEIGLIIPFCVSSVFLVKRLLILPRDAYIWFRWFIWYFFFVSNELVSVIHCLGSPDLGSVRSSSSNGRLGARC